MTGKNRFDMGPQDIAWCPGCGDYGILQVLKDALFEMGFQPEGVTFVSGIGQAAKTPHYIRGNFFNGLHGRALPPATAISIANPDQKVIVTSGDGDMYGEGGNHFIHAIRRNPNITVFVYNNMIYGLTKGQASPTSQKGMKTPVQTEGVFLEPINPLAMAISLDASFVARASIADPEPTKEIVKKALDHRGMAIVDIFQPCVVFNKINTYDWFRGNTYYLGDSYDPSDKMKALEKSFESEKMPLGVFFKQDKPTINDFVREKFGVSETLHEKKVDMEKVDRLIKSKMIQEPSEKISEGENKKEDDDQGDKCASGTCACKSGKSESDKKMQGPKKYRCEIKEIIDETHDVKTFVLRVPDEFTFLPGQHVMGSFPDEREISGKKSIPMTMSNPPTDHNKILVTLRNMGGFTEAVHKLNVGDELMVTEAMGNSFKIDENSEEDFVLITGGTGVAPFMSMIRFFLAKGKKNRIKLFDGNRSPDEVIFKNELDKIAKEQDHIEIVHAYSRDAPEGHEKSYVTGEMIKKHVSDDDINNSIWMLCGPPPLLNSALEDIKEMGVPEEHIRYESWQKPGREKFKNKDKSSEDKSNGSKKEESTSDKKGNSEKAILASDNDEVEVEPGSVITDAAEKLGVPFTCKQGICRTCEAEIVEGAENLEEPTDNEKNMNLPDGHRLCCQAKIKGGRVKIKW